MKPDKTQIVKVRPGHPRPPAARHERIMHGNVIDSGPSNRTILWERDPAHPGGEIYISEDRANTGKWPVEVALTPKVCQRIDDGQLVMVGESGEVLPAW